MHVVPLRLTLCQCFAERLHDPTELTDPTSQKNPQRFTSIMMEQGAKNIQVSIGTGVHTASVVS